MLSESSNSFEDNPDEVFDLIDSNDRVIGQVHRGDVHRDPSLIHRCVHILVFNNNGDLLLQRRSANKDLYPFFYTSSASGHVRSGEDYSTAAVREIEEELSVAPRLTYLGKVLATSEFQTEMIAIYITCCDGPFYYHPTETEGGKFFTLETIRKKRTDKALAMTPGLLAVLTELDRFEQDGTLATLLKTL